jgi:hypothetical protein
MRTDEEILDGTTMKRNDASRQFIAPRDSKKIASYLNPSQKFLEPIIAMKRTRA